MDTVIKTWVALITSDHGAKFEKFEVTQQDIDGYYLGDVPENIDSAISYYQEKYTTELEERYGKAIGARLMRVHFFTEEQFDELCSNILSPDCQD